MQALRRLFRLKSYDQKNNESFAEKSPPGCQSVDINSRRKFLTSNMNFLKSGDASPVSSASSPRPLNQGCHTTRNDIDSLKVESDGNSTTINLTEEQRLILTSMWHKDDFDYLYEIGMAIYKHIFLIAPEAKVLFPYVKEAEENGMDVTQGNQFRRQALRFVQVITDLVTHIENPKDSDIEKHLHRLGERHLKYTSRGFNADLWSTFETAVVFVMTNKNDEDEKTIAVQEAWRVAAKFIVDGMKAGYYGARP